MEENEIKQTVTEQLLWDDRLDGADIRVDYRNGVVTLSGKVANHFAKNAAESDALQVRGVRAVSNQLKVDSASLELPSDEEVRQRVKDAIYWNSRIDYSKIDVLMHNHTATLIGSVDALWKASLAEELAYSVKGVINVINKLSVAPTREVGDERLAGEIMKAMDRNMEIESEKIKVIVEDGLVTLEGAVNSWRENNAAYTAALYTNGVKDIRNNIVIQPGYYQKSELRS